MPINILKVRQPEAENDIVDRICDGEWELPTQIDALESWLETKSALPSGEYIADIGYSVRKNATGGGGVFSVAMMKALVALEMDVYFSEYDWGEDEDDS